MRQIGIVREVLPTHAVVEVSRESACEGCHAKEEGSCSGCITFGSSKNVTCRAENSVGAPVGSRVEVETASGTVILYAAAVFLFPLLLGIAGWFLCGLIGETAAYLGAICGFVLAFLIVYFTLNRTAAKRLDVRILRILTLPPQNQ
jgi:positive regulator of sigma E activity